MIMPSPRGSRAVHSRAMFHFTAIFCWRFPVFQSRPATRSARGRAPTLCQQSLAPAPDCARSRATARLQPRHPRQHVHDPDARAAVVELGMIGHHFEALCLLGETDASAGQRLVASVPGPSPTQIPWAQCGGVTRHFFRCPRIDAETLCQLWNCSSPSIATPSITSPLAIAISSSSDSSYRFRRCSSSERACAGFP
jgi:hypothetical protein